MTQKVLSFKAPLVYDSEKPMPLIIRVQKHGYDKGSMSDMVSTALA